MRCEAHCPPARTVVPVLPALGAAAAVALAVAWLTGAWPLVLAAAAVLAVVTAAVTAAAVKVLLVVFRWLEPLYIHRPSKQRATVRPVVHAELMPARRQIGAPRLAIEGKPVPAGTVLSREREAVR